MSFDSFLRRRILHPPNRPTVSHDRDMAIFAYVEGLKREGCSQREAYRRAAASGRFDRINEDQAEAVKTAHVRIRKRLRRVDALFDFEATFAEARAKRARLDSMIAAALARDDTRARLMTPDRNG